jgi:hypothetical protein
MRLLRLWSKNVPTSPRTKKADVAEHPEVFDHVGLLANAPLGMAELLSI